VTASPSYRILEALDAAEVQGLLSQSAHRDLAAGEIAVQEGVRNGSLFLIESGSVEVVKRRGEGEEVLAHLGPGNFFGELSVFDPGLASATVRAARPARLRVLEGGPMGSYLTAHPVAAQRLYLAVLSELSRRLRKLDTRLVERIVWVRPGSRSGGEP
jgi:CRP-like cAMP-binding protein